MFRDPERAEKLRVAVRYLLEKKTLRRGHQSRLAEHFGISRQRVNQIVDEERARTTIRFLLDRKALARGHSKRIAAHFGISGRQVGRIIDEERERSYAPTSVNQPRAPEAAARELMPRGI
jgi:DNA-binding transcriptional regulator LsrR (DeoR family)